MKERYVNGCDAQCISAAAVDRNTSKNLERYETSVKDQMAKQRTVRNQRDPGMAVAKRQDPADRSTTLQIGLANALPCLGRCVRACGLVCWCVVASGCDISSTPQCKAFQ